MPSTTPAVPALAPVGSPQARPAATPIGVLSAWLGPVADRAILDVGCGAGALVGVLCAQGARATGIDPVPGAIAAAAAGQPAGRFHVAGAQALPFPDASFDAVVLVNALHHVPGPLMASALDEAARVSRGAVLVLEPLAEGGFFEAMRPVEDETAIRAEAQEAIAAAVAEGRLRLVDSGEFDDIRRFPDVDAFLARVVAVDPARAEAARSARAEVAGLFARWGQPEGELVALPQPHRAHLLARP